MEHDIPNCFGSKRMPHHRAENCCNDCPFEQQCDRAEAQAARIAKLEAALGEDSELLTIAWMDGSHRSTKAHRQTIRNLREAGDRLAMFSTYDEDCAINWTHPGCDCGYTTAINAWKELGE